jgi:hypothetical protein
MSSIKIYTQIGAFDVVHNRSSDKLGLKIKLSWLMNMNDDDDDGYGEDA